MFPPRRPPGWRGRIGVIQPAPGVMLEQEWPRRLPADVLFPVARIRLTAPTREGYAALADPAVEAARDLASASAGVVAYACAVGSLFAGPDAEAALVARLAEASGRPAFALAEASALALTAVGARRIAILSPYPPEVDGWIAAYAEARGFSVEGFVPTPVGIATVGNLSPEEVCAVAAAGMAGLPDADALWIPCTAVPTLDALANIEAATGRPAVSGSQALLWRALTLLGVEDRIDGAGQLFDRRAV